MLLSCQRLIEAPDGVQPDVAGSLELDFGGQKPVRSRFGRSERPEHGGRPDPGGGAHDHAPRDLRPLRRALSAKLTLPVLTRSLENEDEADEWTFRSRTTASILDEVLTTAFVLQMDSCAASAGLDCKGLCFRCGKNLNDGDCDCRGT